MAVDTLNSWLEEVAGALRFLLEGVSVVCVAIGFLAALGESLRLLGRGQSQGPRLNRIRLRFGSWLSMALEYQLAADIVATTTLGPSHPEQAKVLVDEVAGAFSLSVHPSVGWVSVQPAPAAGSPATAPASWPQSGSCLLPPLSASAQDLPGSSASPTPAGPTSTSGWGGSGHPSCARGNEPSS